MALSLAACATPPDSPPGAGAGCASLVGRYADAGRPASGRLQALWEVLGLDPDTVDAVPLAERAIAIRSLDGPDHALAIVKTTPPDAIELWSVDARCADGELRFETRSRYESADGKSVTRQQLRFGLIADADGSLVVRRQMRERALGFLDLRPGGDPVEYFRFTPLR